MSTQCSPPGADFTLAGPKSAQEGLGFGEHRHLFSIAPTIPTPSPARRTYPLPAIAGLSSQTITDLLAVAGDRVTLWECKYVRDEPLEVVDPTFRRRLLAALTDSSYDFRTVASLADELDTSQSIVRHELANLGDIVRRPLGQESRYPDWYRLTSKGPTRQERLARLKAIITFSPMDDDF